MIALAAALRRVGNVVREPWQHHEFRGLVFLVILTLAIGTVVYSLAEGRSLLDAFYFSIMTLTTVGFGDFAPITTFGKIIPTRGRALGVARLTSSRCDHSSFAGSGLPFNNFPVLGGIAR